jgi:hypothetical protein
VSASRTRAVYKPTAELHQCAKPAASASGCMCAGQVRSSSNRLFKNGPSLSRMGPAFDDAVCLGAQTLRGSPDTRQGSSSLTKRQSAVSPLSGFAFSSGAGKTGCFMMRPSTQGVGRRSAAPNTNSQIKWKKVAGFSKPVTFSARLLKSDRWCWGVIPDRRSASSRIQCWASPESPICQRSS